MSEQKKIGLDQLPEYMAGMFAALLSEVSELKAQVCALAKQQPTQAPEELLTQGEAIAFLKTTKPTLTAWVKDGLIPKHRLGTRVYFKRSEIIESLKKINTTIGITSKKAA